MGRGTFLQRGRLRAEELGLLGPTALLERAIRIEGLDTNLPRPADDAGKDSLLGRDALRPQRRTTNRRRRRGRGRNQRRRRRRGRRRRLQTSTRGERPFTSISSTARGDADSVLADAVALAVGVFRAASSEDDERCGGEAQHGRSFRLRGRRYNRSLRSDRHRPSRWAGSRSGFSSSMSSPMRHVNPPRSRTSGRLTTARARPEGKL